MKILGIHVLRHDGGFVIIEDGKITQPIKRATLIGTGSDALNSIDMVGNDLAFGPGTCGKKSLSINTLKLKRKGSVTRG